MTTRGRGGGIEGAAEGRHGDGSGSEATVVHREDGNFAKTPLPHFFFSVFLLISKQQPLLIKLRHITIFKNSEIIQGGS